MGEGVDHISFLVDDVRKTFNDLVAKGATPTRVTPEATDGWTAYVEDPDGIWIEIYTHDTPAPYRGRPVSGAATRSCSRSSCRRGACRR